MVVHEEPGELDAEHLPVVPQGAVGEDEDDGVALHVAAS